MRKLFLVAILAVCLVGWMHATVTLANSGYPMHKANPQRNYKTNKPIRCASVSNGKTTVLSLVHSFPSIEQGWNVDSSEITLDDNGWAYASVYVSGYRIHRFNATDGTYDPENYYTVGSDSPKITHLAEGVFYWAGAGTTNIVNASSFETYLNFLDPSDFGDYNSMAPFKNDLMVKAKLQTTVNSTDAVLYFKTSAIDTTFANIIADFTGTSLEDVLIYKSTTSSTEFPIVAGVPPMPGNPTIIASPTYTVTLPNTYPQNLMVVGDEIIVSHDDYTTDGGLYKLNAATGAITLNKTYATFNGESYTLLSPLIYHNGKAFALVNTLDTYQSFWVDLVTGQILASPTDFGPSNVNAAFSTVDQTVLSLGSSQRTSYFELMGLEWDTWKVNVRGRLPDTNNDATKGSVVIGDDCRVHININHRIHTLAPLPIQNVVPILECVDRNTMIGYFTYNNTGSLSFTIPQVDDRNNFSPGQLAPFEEFVPGHGPYYPFSSKILLNASDSFTWVLEDYVLSFTIAPNLYCPETITIVIILTADGPFPQGFELIVRNTFVNVTGISDSRVTLVAKKRSVRQQSTLETELEIAPDPTNQEPAPSQVVQDFTQYQSYDFTQQVQGQEGAPSGIQTSVAGKSQPTAVQGQIPPEPVAPPTSPVTPTAVPVSDPTSAASAVQVVSLLMAALVMMFIVL
eukprot:TRINITY_DN4462_c0_g1_i2.p1 TRINITY_DN4462_c0_g1~~TRINITY_DN4462_c0_g1_i2.p1  ORF type:complete len:692 (-),score=91.54 TRINITY_DN4462_c0_g1_i2:44-2095(-)